SSNSGQRQISTQYDEVFVDSSFLEDTESLPQSSQNAELLLSADRLPPPPLPLQPPLGPEFYPSNSEEPSDLKPVRRFIPDSWKNFFKGRRNNPELDKPPSDIKYTSSGVECSPPASPVQQNHKSAASSYKDPYGGSGGSYNSGKQAEAMLTQDPYASLERHTQMALTYSEKVEAYNLRYSYMKSWAGLLRILCVVELLLGAAVFACVTAYIHKDNEWYNMFGYSQPYGFTANSVYGGYYYIVCLKLWRHEGARRHRELMEQELASFLNRKRNKDRPREEVNYKQFTSVEMKPELLNSHIPSGHIPKPIVMPDYLAKYPAIQTDDERDRYKAVFNDQYAEYKELSAEVQVVLKKFDDLDALMSKLSLHPGNTLEHDRISKVLQEYKKKKNDPTFLEKKERCEYLKNKLSHIKQRIQDYDKVMNWNVQT
uniref:MARVEL domain containing 2 n=1 Tax=Chelonoidis abingdonii TaxID=106734 RepID=A0A8C0H8P5_CHEAB